MNDIVHFLIVVFILIAFVCAPYFIIESKFLIILLKIKILEKKCKKAKKELLEIMKNEFES
jgi:hypothetical protein